MPSLFYPFSLATRKKGMNIDILEDSSHVKQFSQENKKHFLRLGFMMGLPQCEAQSPVPRDENLLFLSFLV